MSLERTYYDILGVAKDADVSEIKKRYRELVRKYHPDVAADKRAGDRKFLEITEAYKTLVDPGRRMGYDSLIAEQTQPFRPAPGPERHDPFVQPGPMPRRQPVPPQLARLIKEAELAFIRRRLGEAASLCRQAISLDRNCARAHAILGDVYRARKKYLHAINEYTYAVQSDPADHATREKMERLISKATPVKFSWESSDGRVPLGIVLLNVLGWSAVFFGLFLIYLYPGRPVPLMDQMNIPLLRNWSWNLVGLMFGDAVLAGLLLGASGAMNHPDEELVFETGGRGQAIVPTGFLLMVFGPLFFLGAAILYLVLAFIQDTISRSIVVLFATIAGIVLFSALLYERDPMSVAILGGNVAYVGAVIGWYLGAIIKA